MRYFLVSFSLTDKWSLGTVSFANKGFPSKGRILECVKSADDRVVDIVLLNIFEFSNEEDFNSYNGTES